MQKKILNKIENYMIQFSFFRSVFFYHRRIFYNGKKYKFFKDLNDTDAFIQYNKEDLIGITCNSCKNNLELTNSFLFRIKLIETKPYGYDIEVIYRCSNCGQYEKFTQCGITGYYFRDPNFCV
jgi:hypothetical protein